MAAYRFYSPYFAFVCLDGQLVEYAVCVHQEAFGDCVADSHPFGVPCVVPGVAAFGQQVSIPFALGEYAEDDARFCPAGGVDCAAAIRIASGVAVDLYERISLDDCPFLSVPFCEAAGVSLAEEFFLVVSIVGDDDSPGGGVGGLEMLFRGPDFQLLCQIEELFRLERMDIQFPEFSFHSEEVNFVLRVCEVVY